MKRIDESLHAEIVESATVIGDRINGLKDGVSNEWFATFYLKTPAAVRGQEPSVVIDRPVLQELLLKRVGDCASRSRIQRQECNATRHDCARECITGVTKGQEVVGCEREESI